MKTCTTCGKTKPKHEFYRDAGCADGRKTRCIDCDKADFKLLRERKKEMFKYKY